MSNWQYAAKLPSLPGRGEMTLARHLFLRLPYADPPPTPSQEPLLLVQEPVLALAPDKINRAMFGGPSFQDNCSGQRSHSSEAVRERLPAALYPRSG